jgi:hypothetical protein
VPSRTLSTLRNRRLLVGDQLAIDAVGDPAFETAHRLHRLLALSALASVVGPTLGIETELGHRGEMDHVVHPSVPRSGEPVPVLLA